MARRSLLGLFSCHSATAAPTSVKVMASGKFIRLGPSVLKIVTPSWARTHSTSAKSPSAHPANVTTISGFSLRNSASTSSIFGFLLSKTFLVLVSRKSARPFAGG